MVPSMRAETEQFRTSSYPLWDQTLTLSRSGGPTQVGPPHIWLDQRALAVGVGDRSARLTAGGFAMLELLIRRQGEMVTFEELAQAGRVRSRARAESALHTAVYRVRKALEELGAPTRSPTCAGSVTCWAATGPCRSHRASSSPPHGQSGHPCWSRSGGSCCSRTTQRFGAFGEVEGAIVREETPASRSLLGGDRELLEYDLV